MSNESNGVLEISKFLSEVKSQNFRDFGNEGRRCGGPSSVAVDDEKEAQKCVGYLFMQCTCV